MSTDLTNPLFPPGADDAGDVTSIYLVMGDMGPNGPHYHPDGG